jgi:hypothetical protein
MNIDQRLDALTERHEVPTHEKRLTRMEDGE